MPGYAEPTKMILKITFGLFHIILYHFVPFETNFDLFRQFWAILDSLDYFGGKIQPCWACSDLFEPIEDMLDLFFWPIWIYLDPIWPY